MTDNASDIQSEEPGSNPGVRIFKSLDGHPYFSLNEDLKVEDIYLKLVDDEHERESFRTAVPWFHSYKQSTAFVGRQVNWLIMCGNTCLGSVGLGSSVRAMKPRDEYIGWDISVRSVNLVKTANNWRFTIKPEAPPNAGSKVLSLMMKECRKVWKEKYGDNLVLLETLVEPPRKGTVYLANGWILVGETKGTEFKWMKKEEAEKFVKENKDARICSKNMRFGDADDGMNQVAIPNKKSKKLIFVKPLHRYWKKELMKIDDKKEKSEEIKEIEKWL